MADCDFEEWAFGPGSFNSTMDRMHAWNERHGDKLRLDGADLISESLEKMRKIYDPSYQERAPKARQAPFKRAWALGRQILVRLRDSGISVVAWLKAHGRPGDW